MAVTTHARRNRARRRTHWLALAGLVLLALAAAGCARIVREAMSAETTMRERAAIPPMDAAAPEQVRTATFSLG